MKPRSDSKLKNLPTEQQDLIAEWCREQGGLENAKKKCRADFNISTSLRALSEFYSYWDLQRRFQEADSTAAQIAELIQKRNPNMSPDHIRELSQSIFTIEAAKRGDSKDYVNLEYLRLAQDSAKVRAELEKAKIELADRRVTVAEKKLERLHGTLNNEKLTDAQKVQRMRQVFGT